MSTDKKLHENIDLRSEDVNQLARNAEKTTLSGISLKEFYTPADTDGLEYTSKLGNPGVYPYTRGIHRDMYRGKI
ncbi:hypothetical protein B9Q09_02645, partial [Candidatus Marsarchaeota G2 archaeon ECH_B_SAG-C16]